MKKTTGTIGLFIAACVFAFAGIPVQAAECNPTDLVFVGYGQSGSGVQTLQKCLIEGGFNIPAGPTGYFGTQTKTAVQSFYNTVLHIPNWNGLSIGPKGRTALSGLFSGEVGTSAGLRRIQNETELIQYLTDGEKNAQGGSWRGFVLPEVAVGDVDTSESLGAPASVGKQATSDGAPGRVSGTNVQVAGIDEPDIVKTDGTTIYFSREGNFWYVDDCINCKRMILPPQGGSGAGVTAISAFPLSSLGIASETIEESGEMLLTESGATLIIFVHDKIVAYDVTNPKKPIKKWTNKVTDDTRVIAARLKHDVLYVVTGSYINSQHPCPVIPMAHNDVLMSIPCGDMWVPVSTEPVNQSFSIFALNPNTGEKTDVTTVLGDSNNTTVYVSENNIYLAYRMQNTVEKVMVAYLINEAGTILSPETITRIRTLDSYDISIWSKMTEIMNAIEKQKSSLSENDRMKFENNLENGMRNYVAQHLRDTDKTTIVRMPLTTLDVAASGVVSGHLLNQFAMDEWENTLRVAVTVGDQWGVAGDKTVNDVYVLDQSFAKLGSILDLGIGERIYSVRFIGDRGYVVTFRQTDPFYVLDLSTPSAPKVTGELKIPGYSAYLEQIADGRVLGVGREGGSVKLALYDVHDASNPKEISKYLLKETWTEVENNHHAFLKDAKHSIFFIPGGMGGYVFSYKDDKLALEATVAEYQVKRAVYIEDNLYIIGENRLTIFDENTWKESADLDI